MSLSAGVAAPLDHWVLGNVGSQTKTTWWLTSVSLDQKIDTDIPCTEYGTYELIMESRSVERR